jgi:hypothetical protein
MAQEITTTMMSGGLDLVTPPIAMPAGKAISAANYEPDVAGYTSSGGYERFDGQPRPSDASDAVNRESRREAIDPVPGTGPVRGVWVFDGDIYAFRDQIGGVAAQSGMFKATGGGWVQQAYGTLLPFVAGSDDFVAGEYVVGATSLATAYIDRVVLRAGAWNGSAEGYIIVSKVTGGPFTTEAITGTSGGAATGLESSPLLIQPGGRYDFTNHNFYGASDRVRMYFANGVDTAYEWNGSVLVPIRTGQSSGTAIISYLLASLEQSNDADEGAFLLAYNGDSIITSSTGDAPTFVSHYKNHLFLGYSAGSVINSSIGEPLEYITTTGAGEIAFGESITGLLTAASTSLVIFGQNRIEYLTGEDSTTFVMNPISDASGGQPYTAQMMDTPMFLDDGGVRSLPTTAAFGDWRMGSVTQPIETLIRAKRDNGITPVASMTVKGKDQYKLFWSDGSGITVYIGRKHPETLPFKLPVQVFCTCQGEVETGRGDRLFIGAEDGYVYEMNRGTSFDGAEIESYIRLPFTPAKSPQQHTRWMKASYEILSPDDITIGMTFDVDYARGLGGANTPVPVDAGTAILATEDWEDVDWTQPVAGRLEHHLSGIGPNIAATLIHNSKEVRQHTISSQTYNFSRRGLKR